MIIRRDTYPFTEQDISIVEMNAKDAHIAELEAALDGMTIERGRAQEELREVLDSRHDRIAELEAERDRLANIDNSRSVEAQEIKSEFVRLQAARIAELEAALRPFAEEADRMRAGNPEWFAMDQTGMDYINAAMPTVDWANAAAAIRARPAP